ncbi:response regulator transcription factor [Vibrio plantisponsor]|jgi:two-component system uhpT operon response regulator UhpA|uniref:Response regulator transcription factor n=1 Tax=Vibrio plantisponsor TaxID=664643 RepID=A0ABU4IFZ8_9VIBR|nr:MULTISPECIES: response regulator transcription factor [Vibrio]MCF7362600.1 response regulator transcription factor [Vibrio sp. A1-b2]MDW6016470.1 response regulator transcription factor [Vibrio plantisponsor]NNM41665.1 response regulator transcription factor [Vibrio plantisponsor]PNH90313.1 DNA-binding response regulator [Vibrio diazotrophicus]PNH93038.1 DNA-binding response regulator [Vibrio diazotrophicus]
MIKIALIDDHTIVRSGFAQLLNLEQDIVVASEFDSAKDAFHTLTQTPVDVAVIDISMPDENGLSLLERLRRSDPAFKAIILSIYDSASFVKKALDAGAQGYLSKRCGPSELASAIRTVASGKRYLCADALINLSNPDINNVLVELTKRELEVFDQLIKGKEVKEIAQSLFLSHKTVHVHRANILSKLNLTNNVDLIRFAIHHHLLAEG